eukprot:Nk52_evm28s252 gene=Nk52_evmTU28s252
MLKSSLHSLDSLGKWEDENKINKGGGEKENFEVKADGNLITYLDADISGESSYGQNGCEEYGIVNNEDQFQEGNNAVNMDHCNNSTAPSIVNTGQMERVACPGEAKPREHEKNEGGLLLRAENSVPAFVTPAKRRSIFDALNPFSGGDKQDSDSEVVKGSDIYAPAPKPKDSIFNALNPFSENEKVLRRSSRVPRTSVEYQKTKVNIHLACTDLPFQSEEDVEICAVVLYKECESENFSEIHKTEIVKGTNSPVFANSFQVQWYFSKVQNFKILLCDCGVKQTSLGRIIGHVEFDLGLVASTIGVKKHFPIIKNGKTSESCLVVRTEEVFDEQNWFVRFQFKASFRKKSFLAVAIGSTEYLYFVINKKIGKNEWEDVYSSEVLTLKKNGTWDVVTLSMEFLCDKDKYKELKIEIFEFKNLYESNFLGHFITSVHEMKEKSNALSWNAIDPEVKFKNEESKRHVRVDLVEASIESDHTFLEYISGGCKINFSIAIDFTTSNGEMSSEKSLHYFDITRPNRYMRAIAATSKVIQHYDKGSKMIPVYGIGAIPMGGNKPSFDFALNGSKDNPKCDGLVGTLSAYQMALQTCTQSSGCRLAPLIRKIITKTEHATQTYQWYNVLMILTAGDIEDIDKTKDAIVEASKLPISIVIVGVGDNSYSKMQQLADDVKYYSCHGVYASREILQFVSFAEFAEKSAHEMEDFATEVLQEIPSQLLDYMRRKYIVPSKT